MIQIGLIMIIPLLVAIYTITFGTYNWRHGNIAGAIGVYFLAGLSIIVPLLVMLIKLN